MKYFSIFIILPLFSIHLCTGCERNEAPPNVIFVLADDLGWSQTSAYGSDYYLTPNIDRLASNGMKFSAAYTACAVCSPTRASIMTGKYPARLHLTDFIKGNSREDYPLSQPDWQKYLPLEEYTLGELFRDHGYRTALFGKWHLSQEKFGPESLPYNPDKQGFDDFFIIDKPTSGSDPEGDPSGSDSIGNATVEFIRENAGQPFFVVMSFSAIHHPLMESADSIRKWERVKGSDEPANNPVIAAMLSRLDRNIGKVMGVVEELNLKNNTIVVFYSDNGGLVLNKIYHNDGSQTYGTVSQSPLREGKGWLYEGGIRVPLVISWPGMVRGGQTSDERVISNDFFPTFCELLKAENTSGTDGISILSHLTSGTALPDRPLFWHYPHYHSSTGMVPAGAIRQGRYKLIEWYENSLLKGGEGTYELFDIENDISETVNLVDSLPGIARELARELETWREDVDAQMPVPNPDYGMMLTGGFQ